MSSKAVFLSSEVTNTPMKKMSWRGGGGEKMTERGEKGIESRGPHLLLEDSFNGVVGQAVVVDQFGKDFRTQWFTNLLLWVTKHTNCHLRIIKQETDNEITQ